jgi:hypothetical protein
MSPLRVESGSREPLPSPTDCGGRRLRNLNLCRAGSSIFLKAVYGLENCDRHENSSFSTVSFAKVTPHVRALARGRMISGRGDAKSEAGGGHGLTLSTCRRLICFVRGRLAHSPNGGLCAVIHSNFAEERLDVNLDGGFSDIDLPRYDLV